MLTHWNKLLNTECIVVDVGPHTIYPIFRVGHSTLMSVCDKKYVNKEIDYLNSDKQFIYGDVIYIREKKQIYFWDSNLLSLGHIIPYSSVNNSTELFLIM